MRERTGTAILAGGCFWIMQQLLRDRDGVISTRWLDRRPEWGVEREELVPTAALG